LGDLSGFRLKDLNRIFGCLKLLEFGFDLVQGMKVVLVLILVLILDRNVERGMVDGGCERRRDKLDRLLGTIDSLEWARTRASEGDAEWRVIIWGRRKGIGIWGGQFAVVF
jgi:hypothetical protein